MTDRETEDRDYLNLVSRRIRAARVMTGVTQHELAELAGLSRVTLGSIERGDHAAGLLTYLKLSRACGARMGALLDEEPT